MWNNKQQEAWDDIKNQWNKSSHSKDIKTAMSQLAIESNNWMSPFEKNGIKKDIEMIRGSISQDEKEFIKKDIISIKKNINLSESNFLKSGVTFITRVIKNVNR